MALTPYKGLDVLTSGVKITNAGDGLSKAMQVDPAEYPHGTTLHVVVECEVVKHTYEEIKDTDALTLIHHLKAGRATIVDGELVVKFLDDQEAAIAEAEGEPKLTFVDEPESDTE